MDKAARNVSASTHPTILQNIIRYQMEVHNIPICQLDISNIAYPQLISRSESKYLLPDSSICDNGGLNWLCDTPYEEGH